MVSFNFADFLARSTERSFDDTTLSKVLSALPSLSPSGPWIGGGAIRRTLLQQEPDSDFDFFFRDADQLSAFEDGLQMIGLAKVRETEHHKHYRGKVADSDLPRDFQLIRFAFYDSAAAVIDSFDFTVCQFVFDGEIITAGDYSLWDLGRRRLAVHKITYPVSSTRRMLKYAQQGFTACSGCITALLRETRAKSDLPETAYVD